VSEHDTLATMARHWRRTGVLICPHTAVARAASLTSDDPLPAPVVTLATAHPAKFPETVARATGQHPPLPERQADLFARAENVDVLANDLAAVKAYIRERSRAWR
jgi:threonine synthase